MQKSYFRQKSTTFEQRQLSNPVPIQHKIHYYFIKYKTHFFLSLQQQNKVLAKTRRKKNTLLLQRHIQLFYLDTLRLRERSNMISTKTTIMPLQKRQQARRLTTLFVAQVYDTQHRMNTSRSVAASSLLVCILGQETNQGFIKLGDHGNIAQNLDGSTFIHKYVHTLLVYCSPHFLF